jgi:hypothetical protein
LGLATRCRRTFKRRSQASKTAIFIFRLAGGARLSPEQPAEKSRLWRCRRQKAGHEVVMASAQFGKLLLIAFGPVAFAAFALFRLAGSLAEFLNQLGPDWFVGRFFCGRRGKLALRRSENPDQFGDIEKALAVFKMDLRLGKFTGGDLSFNRPLAGAEKLGCFLDGNRMCHALCHALPK